MGICEWMSQNNREALSERKKVNLILALNWIMDLY